MLKSIKDAFDEEVLKNVPKEEKEAVRAALEGGRPMPWDRGARSGAGGAANGTGTVALPAPPPANARGGHGTTSGRWRPSPSPNARRRPKVSEGQHQQKVDHRPSSSTPTLYEGSMYDIKRAGMDQLPPADGIASFAATMVGHGGGPSLETSFSPSESQIGCGMGVGVGERPVVAGNSGALSKSKRFVLAKEVRKLMRSRNSGGRTVRVRRNAPFAPTWEKRASQWLTKYFYGNLRRVRDLYGKRQSGRIVIPIAVRVRMLLPIFSACFNELIRRIGTECTQRASIVMRIWKGVLQILHRGTLEMRQQRRE